MSGNYTFVPHEDSVPDRISIGHFVCNRCGMIVQNGIMNICNHESDFHTETVLYKVYTDNEMRVAFMELGLPSQVYKAFKYAQPTDTEKEIYKK